MPFDEIEYIKHLTVLPLDVFFICKKRFKMEKIDNSYVVSEDIGLILEGNSMFGNFYRQKNIMPPRAQCLDKLRSRFKSDLSSIFKKVDIIPQSEMYFTLNRLVRNSSLPVISLDRIYLSKNTRVEEFLDITRLRTSEGVSLTSRRDFSTSPYEEIMQLSTKLAQKFGDNMPEVALADDIVFSGESLFDIIGMLGKSGVRVKEVISAVCVEDTFERFKSMGIDMKTGVLLNQVVDQVCERDFYFGVAQSGMAMAKGGEVVKTPYFSPFGNPQERASIPSEFEKEFSIGCIDRSIDMWQEMESLSNKDISTEDLPEKIDGVKNSIRVVDVLEEAKIVLEEGQEQ